MGLGAIKMSEKDLQIPGHVAGTGCVASGLRIAQTAQMNVIDSLPCEGRGKRLFRETFLARNRRITHVHQSPHTRAPQRLHKDIRRTALIANGHQYHTSLLAKCGITAPFAHPPFAICAFASILTPILIGPETQRRVARAMAQLYGTNDTEALRKLDADHHFHAQTDTKTMIAGGGSRIINRADGCYVWDTDGNRILDGMAGLWCVNVGYGRAELADVAREQMLTLPYYNTFFKTATPPVIHLAARISALLPDGFNHVFFNNSGSEAADTAMRLVRTYWDLMGKPTKKTFISRWNGYHGSTMAAASLGGMKGMHAQGDLPIPGVVHIDQPYWFEEGGDENPADFGRRAARALEDKILELGADSVAAFIGEPVQGAGGVVIPPGSYWPEINRICKQYDVLLVDDEVICGFGRTGNWFALETFGIEPDLVNMAKGLSSGYVPISAVAIKDRVADVLIDQGGEFTHGYTYSGHPVACAVALRNIDIIAREGLVDRVRDETGPYLAQALGSLADHPIVGEVRSIGLLGAIELVQNRATRERFSEAAGQICRDHCFANNLVMRAVRDTMVMSPALIIEPAQIDELVHVARHCLDLTARDLGVAIAA